MDGQNLQTENWCVKVPNLTQYLFTPKSKNSESYSIQYHSLSKYSLSSVESSYVKMIQSFVHLLTLFEVKAV